MPRIAVKIILSDKEKSLLKKNISGQRVEKRMYLRSKIILLSAEGKECIEIAKMLGISEKTCRKWRNRFAKQRMDGLNDLQRTGAPELFTEEEKMQIIQKSCSAPVMLENWTLANITQWAREFFSREVSIESIRQILKTADKSTIISDMPDNVVYMKKKKAI
ncbi:helix-turn-helix domain-containing protein [Pectinatus brassicae]|uniref:Transposase n=1 Tax=Pectinatus brassicae TaxID=862415 RepID=A0A840UIE0_9FIRM|nr:helix-turn-helix domain-containing protein [Pectinatus brassicae]MBB5337511.1 transposase [Pectinatus brassicae]